MGKSSGGGSTTTKSKPYLAQQVKDAAGYATDLYKQGLPAYYPGSTIADPSAETNASLDAITARANGGAGIGLNDAAAQQYLKTINGDYLNSNPYLDQVIAASGQDVTNNFLTSVLPTLQSNFAASGRYGSGIADQAVNGAINTTSQNIADAAANLRYQNYSDERSRQLAASTGASAVNQARYQDAQALSSVGTARDALNQARLQDQIDRYNYNQNADATNLDNYIARIMQLNGSYGSTTNTQANTSNGILSTIGGLAGLAGAGQNLGLFGSSGGTSSGSSGGGVSGEQALLALAAQAAFAASDIRLKDRIVSKGSINGHNIYEFSYLGDDKRYSGVMAQEVMATMPEAVHVMDNGFYGVDYNMIGVPFVEVTSGI